jgi:RNA polymerase sigma-70 factor (ECF subfamily)
VGTAGVDATGRSNFLALYDDAAPQVYRYLFRMCAGSATLAEDLTQETFLTALGRFEDGRGGEVSIPWLMVVARNKLLEHHRRVGREDRRLRLVFSRDDERPSTVERTVSQAEAIALLQQLPHDQRIALALRYAEDLEVADVASAMGRSVRATESLLARARRTLRRRAEESGDE